MKEKPEEGRESEGVAESAELAKGLIAELAKGLIMMFK